MYSKDRQPVIEVDEEDFEETLQVLVDVFDLQWLNDTLGISNLQKIWCRNDYLASLELYFLGKNLIKLKDNHLHWLLNQIQIIKTGDFNNSQGAYFEINALGLLQNGQQIVKPTKNSNPGVDGIISLPSYPSINVSLKNYGDSQHYKDFIKKSKLFEVLLSSEMGEKKVSPIRIKINAGDHYPKEKDWDDLEKNLPKVLQKHMTEGYYRENIGGWVIEVSPLSDNISKFASERPSYTLSILSDFFRNERKNLFDKLEEACSNLSKHNGIESSDSINIIIVHLPELSSINLCKKWAEEYFNLYPKKPISGVIFYRPNIVVDPTSRVKNLNCCFDKFFREDHLIDIGFNPPVLSYDLPTGEVSSDISSECAYYYQSGDHCLAPVIQDNKIDLHIDYPETGIFIKALLFGTVFELIAPPNDKLLII